MNNHHHGTPHENFNEIVDMQGINALLVEENIELKRKLAICEGWIRKEEPCDLCINRNRTIEVCNNKCKFEINYDN